MAAGGWQPYRSVASFCSVMSKFNLQVFQLRYFILLSPTHKLPSIFKLKPGHNFRFIHLSHITISYSPQLNYHKNFRRNAQLHTSSMTGCFRLSYVESVSVLRVISGFRLEVDENRTLLGHYAASIRNSLPTFRRKRFPPETSLRHYHYSLCNGPEERSSLAPVPSHSHISATYVLPIKLKIKFLVFEHYIKLRDYFWFTPRSCSSPPKMLSS